MMWLDLVQFHMNADVVKGKANPVCKSNPSNCNFLYELSGMNIMLVM